MDIGPRRGAFVDLELGALPVRPDVASDPAYASNIMAPVAANLDKISIPAG